MVTINRYCDAFSPEFDTLQVEAGKTLREVFPGTDFENSLMYAGGRMIDEDFVLRDGVIVSMRTFPSGGVGSAVKSAVHTVVNVWNSSWIGSKVNSFFSGVTSFIKNTIKGWLSVDIDVSSNTPTSVSSEATETIPSIRGARNQGISGRPVPMIIGKSLHTPSYCGAPYTVIGGNDGEDQYYYALLMVGYAGIKVSDIKLGELDLASNSAGVEDGVIAVDGASRFNGVVDLEIRSGASELSLYPQKVVQENVQFQLIHPDDDSGHWLVAERFSATYPQKIEVELSFNNLLRYNDEGQTQEASVDVRLEISFDGGSTYTPFGIFIGASAYDSSTGTSTFTRNKNKAMRFVATRVLSYAEAMSCVDDVAQIRIQRLTRESVDTKVQDKCYVTGIRTWVYDKAKSKLYGNLVPQVPVEEKLRDKTVRIAMKMKASDGFADLNGTINQLSLIAESKCRTWDGSSWSVEKTPSDNPAAVALEVMQSKSLGSYAYTDDKIDLPVFGRLYEFCNAKGIAVGGVLSSQKKLSEVLDMILATARSVRVLNGDKYSVVIDEPRSVPVVVLNNHNFLTGGRSNTKQFNELPDGFRIKFINQRLNYAEDEIFCMMDGKSADDPYAKIESIQVVWQTNPDQVWKYGRYELAKRKLRPESWNCKVGIEGNLVEIGSLVTIQDDTILVGIGDGGEIRSVKLSENGNYIVSVITDSFFNVSDTTKSYAVKIVHADGVSDPSISVHKVIIDEPIYSNELFFESPILVTDADVPAEGDMLSFGVYGSETIDALCFGKKDNADGTFDLTLYPYQEGVYTADSAAIPEFDSKINDIQRLVGVQQLPADYVSSADFAEQMAGLASGASVIGKPNTPSIVSVSADEYGINIRWTPAGLGLNNTIRNYIVEISRDGFETIWERITTMTNECAYTFTRDDDGYPEAEDLEDYLVRVKALNVYGKESNWSDSEDVNTDYYGTWVVSVPVITVRVQNRAVTLVMNQGQRSDRRKVYGNVRYKVMVKRYDDAVYYKPATAGNPYTDELAYKDGDGYITAEGVWIQTMPLEGQSQQQAKNTLYLFRVCAYNEASQSGWVEDINATADCSSLRDIVLAREDYKELYVGSLSAICANLGVISDGMLGTSLNYWSLSTIIDESGKKYYQGAWRVGSEDEYIEVEPVVNDRDEITDYHVHIVAGALDISSTATKIKGDIILMDDNDPYNRLRISPKGNFFEHRDDAGSENWSVTAEMTATGIKTSSVSSDSTLIISNQSDVDRTRSGIDFGNKYLSNSAKVYHFDNDVYDQNGVDDLVITDMPDGGSHSLVNSGNVSTDIAFTTAISGGKVLYGQCSVAGTYNASIKFTVDFWIQYIYDELHKYLFSIEHDGDVMRLLIEPKEFYFEEWNESLGIPFNEELEMTRMYVQVEDGEPYDPSYKYYRLEDDGVTYRRVIVTSETYAEMVEDGLYEPTIVFNELRDSIAALSFYADGSWSEMILNDDGLVLEPNEWIHVAVAGNGSSMKAMINEKEYSFVRSTTGGVLSVSLGESRKSMMVDELMVDTAEMEEREDFLKHARNRLPWAAYSDGDEYFILMAKDTNKVVTNIFETPQFAAKLNALSNDLSERILDQRMPVGSVYWQLPNQLPPQTLFGGTWQNISSVYAGLFFRAEGGNAATFGDTQGMEIQSHGHGFSGSTNETGSHSHGYTACTNGGLVHEGDNLYIFNSASATPGTTTDAGSHSHTVSGTVGSTGGVETRPVNVTIRIWKRTA